MLFFELLLTETLITGDKNELLIKNSQKLKKRKNAKKIVYYFKKICYTTMVSSRNIGKITLIAPAIPFFR